MSRVPSAVTSPHLPGAGLRRSAAGLPAPHAAGFPSLRTTSASHGARAWPSPKARYGRGSTKLPLSRTRHCREQGAQPRVPGGRAGQTSPCFPQAAAMDKAGSSRGFIATQQILVFQKVTLACRESTPRFCRRPPCPAPRFPGARESKRALAPALQLQTGTRASAWWLCGLEPAGLSLPRAGEERSAEMVVAGIPSQKELRPDARTPEHLGLRRLVCGRAAPGQEPARRGCAAPSGHQANELPLIVRTAAAPGVAVTKQNPFYCWYPRAA